MKELASNVSASSNSPWQMRPKTELSKVLSAPWAELEPTSSLSNTHRTGMLPLSPALRKPFRQPQTHSRSSSAAAEIYSLSIPQIRAFSRMYRYRSCPRILPPAASSRHFWSCPAAFLPPSRGRVSTAGFHLIPSLALRFWWMARFGIMQRSRSMSTRRLSMPCSVSTSTRPAMDRGRSSQGEISIPP